MSASITRQRHAAKLYGTFVCPRVRPRQKMDVRTYMPGLFCEQQDFNSCQTYVGVLSTSPAGISKPAGFAHPKPGTRIRGHTTTLYPSVFARRRASRKEATISAENLRLRGRDPRNWLRICHRFTGEPKLLEDSPGLLNISSINSSTSCQKSLDRVQYDEHSFLCVGGTEGCNK